MSAPYYFDQINQVESHIVPGVLKPSDNALSMYYRRYLAQRAFGIYQFDGLPDNWNEEYLKWVLICYGVVAVLKTDKFGVIPQQCGFSGYDVYYRPTRALVVNPLFDKTYELKIGQQCELIRLSPDWHGMADIIGHFAEQLAITTTSVITNLYNSRASYVFSAGTKAIAESFKLMYDKIAQGEPAVFADKNLFNEDGTPNWIAFQQDLNSVFIVDKLHAAHKDILNQFYSHIGIPNMQVEKKERLTEAESKVNNYATMCLVNLWKSTMEDCLEKVNAMFGLSVKVDFNEKLKEALENNVDGNGNITDPKWNEGVQKRSV